MSAIPDWCLFRDEDDLVLLGKYSCRYCYRVGHEPSSIAHTTDCRVSKAIAQAKIDARRNGPIPWHKQ